VIVQLREDAFQNGFLRVPYGNQREVTFTLLDEDFIANGKRCVINRILIVCYEYALTGVLLNEIHCTSVIGLADAYVRIVPNDPALFGGLLSKDTMERVVVEVYE
jgi:hypothetical protein